MTFIQFDEKLRRNGYLYHYVRMNRSAMVFYKEYKYGSAHIEITRGEDLDPILLRTYLTIDKLIKIDEVPEVHNELEKMHNELNLLEVELIQEGINHVTKINKTDMESINNK